MTQDSKAAAGPPANGMDLAAAADAVLRTCRAEFRIIGILTECMEFKGTNQRGEYAMHSLQVSLMGDGFELGLRGKGEDEVYRRALPLKGRIVQIRGQVVKVQSREHRHCFELQVSQIEAFAGV